MWIDRHIAAVVKRAFAQFPALVLSGARQAGKTSLVRHLFPQAEYVTLDIPRDAETARLNPAGFLVSRQEPLSFDEVQQVLASSS
jgi:predicted AAA+ superfamily ATPase